jgi:hypothetical protein
VDNRTTISAVHVRLLIWESPFGVLMGVARTTPGTPAALNEKGGLLTFLH